CARPGEPIRHPAVPCSLDFDVVRRGQEARPAGVLAGQVFPGGMMQMNGFARIAAGLAAGLLLAAPAAAQDRADWPSSLKVGTASQGGTYFIYGAGWAGLVQQDLDVPTSTEVTGGPVQNFALVQ